MNAVFVRLRPLGQWAKEAEKTTRNLNTYRWYLQSMVVKRKTQAKFMDLLLSLLTLQQRSPILPKWREGGRGWRREKGEASSPADMPRRK